MNRLPGTTTIAKHFAFVLFAFVLLILCAYFAPAHAAPFKHYWSAEQITALPGSTVRLYDKDKNVIDTLPIATVPTLVLAMPAKLRERTLPARQADVGENQGMTEFMGWIVILGLVFAIAGIYMLSSRIEKHMRDMAEIIICTNKLILEELKQVTEPTAAASEPTVGVILERRCSHRRAQGEASERAGYMEQRRSPGRRREDLVVVKKAG